MESFNIGRTLSRTFNLIVSTLPSVGLFVLLVQIGNVGVQFFTQRLMMGTLTSTQTSGDPLAALAIFSSGWYWGSIVLSLALGAFTFTGSLHGLLESSSGKPTSLADCVSEGLAKLVPMIGLTLLWYLGVVIGWIALIVPGLILMTMWSVAMPALVGENLGVFASFGRSRELTRGSRMMIFVTLLVVLVVVYVVAFGVLGAVLGGSMMGMASAMTASPLGWLLSIFSGWVFGVLISGLLASIYLETVTIRDGGTDGQLSDVFS
ncbi:hypothetical protein [Novosphingobium mangrovi (ex Huang et al. 2023)]|uniref:Glycerophosphoryl diester phosphodiesterase membrane domain-containing protein n=1 Tax=Novosphingobium mangrovi (ex Huang et al. 2023) TaxID=2976432 RepID=A0ABT2I394_9SPHN|nr:hypothetical protein [Novosphingobium mangrovi (ex Huang et al. 2023)]MCT2399279.1 hypothetical protein [Novosphingobium mangrovi (ex Huang et al. 2023)]